MKKMFIIGAIVTSVMLILAGICQMVWYNEAYDIYGRRIINDWNEIRKEAILNDYEFDVLNSKFEETYEECMNEESYWDGVKPVTITFVFEKNGKEYACYAKSFVEDGHVTHVVRCDHAAALNMETKVFYFDKVNVEF